MKLTIKTREKNLFSGDVNSVTSVNEVGEFDILEQHANFITMISKYIIINKSTPEEKQVSITSGVLKVSRNTIEIFVYALA